MVLEERRVVVNHLIGALIGVPIGLVILKLWRMYRRRIERKAAVWRALGEVGR